MKFQCLSLENYQTLDSHNVAAEHHYAGLVFTECSVDEKWTRKFIVRVLPRNVRCILTTQLVRPERSGNDLDDDDDGVCVLTRIVRDCISVEPNTATRNEMPLFGLLIYLLVAIYVQLNPPEQNLTAPE